MGDSEVTKKKKTELQLLKEKFIEMYGHRCACCGEANPAFLSLDHVNNNGTEHRCKHTKVHIHDRLGNPHITWSENRPALMREVVSEYRPGEYQILCYNCNFGRGHDKDRKCPHERESPDMKAYRRKR